MPPPLRSVMDSTARKSKGEYMMQREAPAHASGADHEVVTIHLSDVDRSEDFPDRIITLEYPDWTLEVGRGSSSDDSIVPRPCNAWYTSKVMSRHHAELTANPITKSVFVKDKGSMHGTYLNGDAVTANPKELVNEDILTFGARVIRGVDSFEPLKTTISFEWADTPRDPAPASANSFTADYSDVDVYSDLDDEIEIIHESHRQPSVEILESPFTPLPNTASSSVNTSPQTKNSLDLTASANTTPPVDTPFTEKAAKDDSVNDIHDLSPVDSENEYGFDYDEDDDSDIGSPILSEDESAAPSLSEQDAQEEAPPLPIRPDSPPPANQANTAHVGVPQSPLSVPRSEVTARDPSPSDAAMAKPRFPDAPAFKPYPRASYDLPRPNDLLPPVLPDSIPFNPPSIPLPSRHIPGTRPLLMQNQYPISDDGTSSDWTSFPTWNSQLMSFQQFPLQSSNHFVDYNNIPEHLRDASFPVSGHFSDWRPNEAQSPIRSISPVPRPKKRKADAISTDILNKHTENAASNDMRAFAIPTSPNYYTEPQKCTEIARAGRAGSPLPGSDFDSTDDENESNASDAEKYQQDQFSTHPLENFTEIHNAENSAKPSVAPPVSPVELPSVPQSEPSSLPEVQQCITETQEALAEEVETETMEERPRKIVKLNHPKYLVARRPRSARVSRSAAIAKTVAKGAAIAMTGAVVGAVGTIWTLASLPSDYFA